MRRSIGISAALALAYVLGSAGSASADSQTVLAMNFDQATTFQQGSLVADTSGSGHDGTVQGLNDGGLVGVADDTDGSAVQFPRCTDRRGCPRADIEVPDAPDLDPRLQPFQFGASIRLTPNQTSRGANVLQKGRYGDADGQWKLQVDGLAGRPSCVISGYLGGTYNRVIVKSESSIADSNWHAVSCARTDSSVELTVDGQLVAAQDMAPVMLSGDAAVTIGAKTVNRTDNDQFQGVLDDIFVTIQ